MLIDPSALHRAVYDGDLERVRELVDGGADVTARAREGEGWITAMGACPRPLNCCAIAFTLTEQHLAIARLLIDHGAVVDESVYRDYLAESDGTELWSRLYVLLGKAATPPWPSVGEETLRRSSRPMEITVEAADLCAIGVDGICTSTNPNLALMIGTGGAVRDRGGWAVQEACTTLIEAHYKRTGKRHVPVGSAHLTTAGNLPFRGVIHCVASDAFHETSVHAIAECVRNAVAIADGLAWTSLAMPLFATGHAAFAIDDAARAMVDALVHSSPKSLQRIVIAIRDSRHEAAVKRALTEISR